MGDAARQLSDRVQLLRLPELCLFVAQRAFGPGSARAPR